MRTHCLLFLLSVLMPFRAFAQMDSLLFERNYEIDSTRTGQLALEIDNVSFFKDLEYDRCIVTGYTLPGLWIQPKVTYQPLDNLHLELGLHSLIYAGKTKYPNTIYQDIGVWKGGDYMEGTHLMPYFRANLELGAFHIILGDLYGGQNHHLIEPLYSHELNLTNDPEMGLQMLFDLKHWHLDAWVNWQSFIFKDDTHQESFIFGINSEAKFGKWTVPLQVIVHHRGGEIQTDTAHTGVKTLMNAALGVKYEQPISTNWLTKISAEAEGTYYIQQRKALFPLTDKGWGAYSRVLFDFKPGIRFDLNYFHCNDYVPLLGDGHYCAFRTDKRDALDTYYKTTNIFGAALEYSRSFSKYYAFGARFETYYQCIGVGNKIDFNFGVFIKCNPRFLLKAFK